MGYLIFVIFISFMSVRGLAGGKLQEVGRLMGVGVKRERVGCYGKLSLRMRDVWISGSLYLPLAHHLCAVVDIDLRLDS